MNNKNKYNNTPTNCCDFCKEQHQKVDKGLWALLTKKEKIAYIFATLSLLILVIALMMLNIIVIII